MIPDVFDDRRRADKEKSALENLFPEPEDLPERIKLIGTLKGTPPTIQALYEAKVVYALLDLMEGKPSSWDKIDMASFYEERTPSLGGKHADRAVQIAQAAPRQEVPMSWIDRIMGKEK